MRYPVVNEYESKPDTMQRDIVYRISETDTDKDGVLGRNDDDDLYISDLDGSNLRRISKDNTITLDYYYLNKNEILIRYVTREKIRSEYKEVFFGKYSIDKNKFEELTSIHNGLKKIEATLTK
jgi:hypothetical protein